MNRRRRGVATIEAICALLVFLTIWAGVNYMGGLYVSQLQSEAKARECAWLISVAACSSTIEECERSLARGDGDAGQSINKAASGADDGGKLGSLVEKALGSILGTLFGERATASTGQSVPRPALLGGGKVEVKTTYSLPCNTKADSVGNLAERGIKIFKDK